MDRPEGTFADGVEAAAGKFRELMVVYEGTDFDVDLVEDELRALSPAPANVADYKKLYHACSVSYVRDVEEVQGLLREAAKVISELAYDDYAAWGRHARSNRRLPEGKTQLEAMKGTTT
jgi:hypothetical protein